MYNGNRVKPLNMFPKTSAYVRSYDEQTKWTYFLIEDDDLLERYNNKNLFENQNKILWQ